MKETAEVEVYKQKRSKVGNEVWTARRAGLKVSGEQTAEGEIICRRRTLS